MGDGISAMWDDFDDYAARCERLKITPVTGSPYDAVAISRHEKELDVMENICKQREDHILGEN